MPVHISELGVELFDCSIDFALALQRSEHLARIEELLKRSETVLASAPAERRERGPLRAYRADGCLVLSFDASWYPFLDDSAGYNRPETRCWYVPKNSILDRVAEAMRNLDRPQSGGRAFLHDRGALAAGNIELVSWTLAIPSKYLGPLA